MLDLQWRNVFNIFARVGKVLVRFVPSKCGFL